MGYGYLPTTTGNGRGAPSIVKGFPVINDQGLWVWSDTGPAIAGVVLDAQGRYTIDETQESTVEMFLDAGGSPYIIGE